MTEGAECGCKSGLSWELGTIGQFLVDTGYLHIPGMAVWWMCNRSVAMHMLWVGRRREGDGERVPVLCIAGSSMQGVPCAACRVPCAWIFCGIVHLCLAYGCVSSGHCLWPPDQAKKHFFISEVVSQ